MATDTLRVTMVITGADHDTQEQSSFMTNLYFRLNYDFSIIIGSKGNIFGLILDT